jgi:hypothetical protein
MVVKQRSLNELRQEKEFGYKNPAVKKKEIKVDSKVIIELVKKYPNDSDLGKKVRSYLIELGIYE